MSSASPTRPRARSLLALLVAAATVLTSIVVAVPAAADTSPPSGTPETVSADPLPTVQINGVVWDQEIVGNRVYAGGSFTQARPAGSAAGVNTVTRNNVLAYDLHSGNLVTSWNPSANAQVMDVAKSPDGSRIYVGGAFTNIAGANRFRIAAFDAATGNLITSFNASLDGRVETIVATNTTVYVGGAFTAANSTARYKVAAFNASNGALLPWRPILNDGTVYALQLAPDGNSVVLGGSFTSVNGSSNPGFGLARVNATTGANLPLPANSLLRNAGTNASVWGLGSDATNLYVVAYTFGGGGTLEGTAAVRWSNGELHWISDCHGDSYDAYSTGSVVYTASHNHYCGNNGSFPQTEPWSYYRATARTTVPTMTIGKEPLGYGNWEGRPGPTILNWFPEINAGTYTGQSQGPWSVSGDASQGYVVFGGEFTRVNSTNQQGIVRFATRNVAPNNVGPRFSGTAFPIQARALASGTVRVSWQANADYDNESLTYRVIRDGQTGSPVYETTVPTQIWRRPFMGFTDTGLPPGTSHTYRVTVTDPFGNVATSPTVTVVANATGSVGSYASQVLADGASHYWRLGETSGPSVRDWAHTADGTASAGVTFGATGAIAADSNRAVDLASALNSRVLTPTNDLASNFFSIEAWVRATGTERGRLVGYGNASSAGATSSRHDRLLYLDNSGRFNFGINPAQIRVITSPNSYNNGQWHHVVATMGADGMRLFVNGQQVATRSTGTTAGNYYGAWILGADTLSGWTNRPSTDYFAGQLDEVAIYPRALPASVVQQHYALGRAISNLEPTASFTATMNEMTANVNASASTDVDGTITSYAWNWGDGTPNGSGVTASHTYANPGSYTITLTVTDDDGATAQTTQQVSAFQAGGAFAVDTFGRSVANGWGSADLGGAWTLGGGGAASNYSVSSGVGRIVLPSTDATRWAVLQGTSQTNVDAQVVASLDKQGTGSGTDLSLTGRRISNGNEYRAQAKVVNGVVRLALRRYVAGTPTTLTQLDIPGLTYSPGQQLRIRMQVEGTSPTTLRAKAWVGQNEPSSWHVQTTDSTAGLQAAGSVGVLAYLAGSATNAPVTATFDDFRASPLGATPPPTNQSPTASFTATASGMVASVNASASNDPDGTITSYAWNWGDGSTGTGVTANRTYATPGTYTITLTVTDNGGATAQTTRQVTVTSPPVGGAVAQDAFGRTVSNGWGSADVGGAWTISGTASNFSVSSGLGRMVVPAAGNTRSAALAGISGTSFDTLVSAGLDKAATGGGTDLSVLGRRVNANTDYRAQAKVLSTGAVSLSLRSTVAGTAATLASATVPGLTYTAGQQLRIRMEVFGTSPTTLRAKVWLVGQAEPAAWHVQTTNSTAALQAAGGVGLVAYLSSSATNAPVAATFDDLVVNAGP